MSVIRDIFADEDSTTKSRAESAIHSISPDLLLQIAERKFKTKDAIKELLELWDSRSKSKLYPCQETTKFQVPQLPSTPTNPICIFTRLWVYSFSKQMLPA